MRVKDKKALTLKTLNKSNVWDLQENDVFRLWEAAEKDADIKDNARHYLDILKSAFEIEELKVDKPEIIKKYEARSYKVGQLRIDESSKSKWAVKKRPIPPESDQVDTIISARIVFLRTEEIIEEVANGIALTGREKIAFRGNAECGVIVVAVYERLYGNFRVLVWHDTSVEEDKMTASDTIRQNIVAMRRDVGPFLPSSAFWREEEES